MVRTHYATLVGVASVGQIWGRWERNKQYFLFFAAYPGCPASRPEMQLLNGLSPSCSVLACCPEVGATWSICEVRPALARLQTYEYVPSDSAISLYPRRKLFLQRETHLQVILQGHEKMGVSCGT